jgi:dihydroorotase
MKILLKNGRIWDGFRFFYGDILTEDMRIAKIEPHIEAEAQYVYDAAGKIVSPGLVDAHVHMAGIEPDPYGINAEMSALPFGVTAVADAGGAHANREIAAACQVKNLTFVSVSIRDDVADFQVAEKKLALYGDRAIGLKVYFDTSSGQVRTIAPLQAICAYARERGLMVMVHCSHSPVAMAEILETLAPGDILTHAYHSGENNAAEDGFASLQKAKQRGVIII